MLLPQIKEREYRFKLALRMGLPIFALVFALIFHTFITSKENLTTSFYIESILILFFSIYFIFYLIYKGFDTKITDNISKAFTREYMYEYLKNELKFSKEYTLVLIAINNLNEINSRYGMKNGDKVILETLKWIDEYLKSKDIFNFPIGRIKGGNFIIGLKGNKNRYKTILEFMALKSEDLKVDDIEIQIFMAINDTSLSDNFDYLIEDLFEMKNRNARSVITNENDKIDPNDLEYYVVNAIKRKDLIIFTQSVFEKNSIAFKECSVKLKNEDGKILHQKSYIKILDKLRLMGDFDLIVLEKIIDICKNDDSNQKYSFFISATSIRNPVLFAKIRDLLSKNEFVKNRIIMLFSENEYYPKVDKFNALLKQLRDFGVIIAVDKVGTLHTSFLYLRDLDLDIVRFSSFYSKEAEKSMYINIIKGFNLMAHEKGIKSWVKMVECKKSNDLVKNLGIDYMQGKYLAPLEKI